jgi:hypothetical protein
LFSVSSVMKTAERFFSRKARHKPLNICKLRKLALLSAHKSKKLLRLIDD